MDFTNKSIETKWGPVYYTRFIASWVREGGDLKHVRGGSGSFEHWLRTLGLSDDEVNDILLIAENGKMELEMLAKKFVSEHKES